MFGAEIYSEAFKRGLEGEVVTSDPDSPAKKELPYEACGSFGVPDSRWEIKLKSCTDAVNECDENDNTDGCKHSVGKWWDAQINELEALHNAQLPQVAKAIAEAACGEEFAVSVTLTTAKADDLAAEAKLKEELSKAIPDTPVLQVAVATPTMLTLSASFETRAEACAAHERWTAAFGDAAIKEILNTFSITEAFVSKHMRKTP